MEVLQATFYVMWILVLFGILVFIITAFILLFQMKKMAEDTKENIENKVTDFLDMKKSEMAMRMAGFAGSTIWHSIFKKKKS